MTYEISYVSFLGCGYTTDGCAVIAIAVDLAPEIDLPILRSAIQAGEIVQTTHISGKKRNWLCAHGSARNVIRFDSELVRGEQPSMILMFENSELFVRLVCEADNPLPLTFSSRNMKLLCDKIKDQALLDKFVRRTSAMKVSMKPRGDTN